MSRSPYHYILPEVIPAIIDGSLMHSVPSQATRYGYAAAIVELGKANPDVVVLNADVAKSIRSEINIHPNEWSKLL